MTSYVISSRATSSGIVLHSGDTASVLSGGIAVAMHVFAGGTEIVSSGGTDSNAVLSGVSTSSSFTFGTQYISEGGLASETRILSDGEQIVSGGASVDAHVNGGLLAVFGGTASAAVVTAAGTVILATSGSVASGVVMRQGVEIVSVGAIDSGLVLSSGYQMVEGGETVGVRIHSGGVQLVEMGAPASPYGQGPSGLASNTIVSAGGEEFVVDGVGISTTILSGGTLDVQDRALNAAVRSGGVVIDAGWAQFSPTSARTFNGILSGSGLLVEDGPGALVLNGDAGAFAGAAVISGGVVELAGAHGLGSGSVRFAATSGAATLRVDAVDQPAPGTTFSTTLSNFSSVGDRLDLRGLSYVSGAVANVSGSRLELDEGGATYDFTLAGGQASAYAARSDGQGGTQIYVPKGAQSLVHAMAAFESAAATPEAGVPHQPTNSAASLIAAGAPN